MGEVGSLGVGLYSCINRGAEESINVGIAHTPVKGHLRQFNEILSEPHTFQIFENKVMFYRVKNLFQSRLEEEDFPLQGFHQNTQG